MIIYHNNSTNNDNHNIDVYIYIYVRYEYHAKCIMIDVQKVMLISWQRPITHHPSRSCGKKLESTLKISKDFRGCSVDSMYFGAIDH